MLENTSDNFGLFKSWNFPGSLADFSPTPRQFKNNRLERVKIKSDEVNINIGGIASAVNSCLPKLAIEQ